MLVGLEAYVKTRKKFKHGVGHVKDTETKVMHPEEHKRKVEEQKDKSKSAEKERQLLAHKAEERKEKSLPRRIWTRLSRSGSEKEKSELSPKERENAKKQKEKKWLSKSGQDVESAIPPEGKRDME